MIFYHFTNFQVLVVVENQLVRGVGERVISKVVAMEIKTTNTEALEIGTENNILRDHPKTLDILLPVNMEILLVAMDRVVQIILDNLSLESTTKVHLIIMVKIIQMEVIHPEELFNIQAVVGVEVGFQRAGVKVVGIRGGD